MPRCSPTAPCCSGMSASERCSGAIRRRDVRGRRNLHALRRPARRRAAGRRHGALSLASRLLQPADRRGGPRPGVEPGRLLACRSAATAGCLSAERGHRARRDIASRPRTPASIVIVGGGRCGQRASETLRREGYGGPHHGAQRRSAIRRATGPICRRTTWPARRARNGFRCGMPTSIGKATSICGLAHASPR